MITWEKVTVKIRTTVILNDISLHIKKGESLGIIGNNGSGKTSLLNMIFADNPKAYKQPVKLFGKPKGSGESIWDIKAKTGFVSPELHQYFPKRLKTLDVICSGLFDTEGLYTKPAGFHLKLARHWLASIHKEKMAEIPFDHLSSSQQKMVLIIRALIKKPPLLIFDEPFQGFDQNNLNLFKELLGKIASDTNCTMVFISHFRDEIPENFNREIRLINGEIEYTGQILN